MNSKKRILIAPLNWGLGHATRCMPIINGLLALNVEVILASDGRAGLLLKKEYPELEYIELPAYNISYRSANMFLNIAPQLPKIQLAVFREYFKIQKIIKTHNIDAIISDNRFGCFSKKVPSIFLTHQLNIKIPNPLAERIVRWINHFYINRFDECWVPDIKGTKNLGGTLSHQSDKLKLKYLGVLSRMKRYETAKSYDIVAVLSGPEPQRTFLEKKLIEQLQVLPYASILIKGKTDEQESIKKGNLEIRSFMTSKELNETMLAGDTIITRSGYSTIMDLAVLQKKAILIPTPGQTEQEYLAKNFEQKQIFLMQNQHELDIPKAIASINEYTGLSNIGGYDLNRSLKSWMMKI